MIIDQNSQREVVIMTEYEKFLELPNEKQLKIINVGFEYFGKYGYKGANTEDIANRAGISKGLLFYYFKNALVNIFWTQNYKNYSVTA